ncbi:fluoride efflux transporter CrcB [Salinicola acroporae]|uniref:Fluoride-specific ion channel FluC n=1 Tax=Salinicola acroporae TaxID=1541440 RepID=A0ABT6IAR9_9GAMM|nr:fluoride efflux transporter CrcB [Salinicola acroporae]MDH4571018.1 fluoride efflux transporter CrcB [Salinicola acroporae]MDH4574558.1 fluoride efflux transporter CrcB [Salinicola acroporae]
MWLSVLSIGAGAAIGANLRWLLGVWLNALFPAIPPGTLVANLLGAWLIGIGIALFAQLPSLSPEVRLFVITGFLGALTTFSTFSAEMFGNIQAGRYGMALLGIGVHVLGSLVMTGLGFLTYGVIQNLLGGSQS